MPSSETGSLKPFTSYICPVGAGRLGHSGLYTGAYREANRRASDGVCICGERLVEEASTMDGNAYRLEFETISPHQAEALEGQCGRGVWARLSDEEWDALLWAPVTKESRMPLEITSQHETLLRWAETREQPIRNVRLLRGRAVEQQEWEEVRAGGPISRQKCQLTYPP